MSDPRLAGFFKQYGGQRLDVADNQPIERGMTDEQLLDTSQRYREMLHTGIRPNGTPITRQEKIDTQRQLDRLLGEIARRTV